MGVEPFASHQLGISEPYCIPEFHFPVGRRDVARLGLVAPSVSFQPDTDSGHNVVRVLLRQLGRGEFRSRSAVDQVAKLINVPRIIPVLIPVDDSHA